MTRMLAQVAVNTVPSEIQHGRSAEIMADEFGAVHTRQEHLAWAEQGRYFRTTGTIGTAIAAAIQTSFSATSAFLLMKNGSSTRKVIPHFIRLFCAVAPASATSCRGAITIDTATRVGTGGTNLLTGIVNSHSGSAGATVVDHLQAGAVVPAAATANVRQISNFLIKTASAPAITVGDEIVINFAGGPQFSPQPLSGTAPVSIVKNVGPVILSGLNHCLLFHLWNPSNASTAPTFEVEVAWWER